uniref:Leucine-rich repeat-containing protein n=1 Tax=Tanacetum cinerariifolium TaxID=118510 RepID=A0A6L2K6D3_TANCI|nr:leucine-rich repeat-containing protein [Tanacetum cinerariifolium]
MSFGNNDYWECLGSSYYPIMMSWNTSTDCCNWNGVTCDYSTGDVVGLDVSCGMLQGTIHPNSSLFNLPHLQRLNLAYNNLTEQIPREIGRFSNSLTHLNLSNCLFSGQVPSDITLLHKLVSLDLTSYYYDLKLRPLDFINLIHNVTNLEELSLERVNISSVLPTSLNTSSLKLLNLGQTQLKGKLPRYIFNLHSLETLDLSANRLTGDIPISVNLTHLTFLDLSFTFNLNGTLPSWLFTSPSLKHLILFGNMFSGNVPFESFNLGHLIFMDLSSNQLNGTLPSWMFTFPSLEYLNLRNNMFSGNVPFESFALPSLKELDLSFNQLGGHTGMQTFRKLTHLTALGLSYNNFSGEWELDTLLSSLTNLESLDLSYSGLSVTTKNVNHYVNPAFTSLELASCKLKLFPNSFRAMKQLRLLDLSSNEIRGQIPHWVGEIGGNELFFVNLSHNFITRLPQFQWYGLLELYLQSNLIEGPFPPSICNPIELRFLDMSNNRFGGLISQCFGKLTSSLRMIDLGNNSFQGSIPSSNNDCELLEGLILKGNQLEGELPRSLSKCRSLSVIDLGNNHLNGTFPGWLEELSELQVLVLKSNKFHGHIQPSFAVEFPFPNLQVLDLSHNRFLGQLPAKYFQNFNSMKNGAQNSIKPEYLVVGPNTDSFYSFVIGIKGVDLDIPRLFVNLTIIDLSNNYFDREIPNMIGNLSSLKVLNLSHNNLNGRIPFSLGNLSEIESLDLSWNQLTGEIPESLAGIKRLEVLSLSHNRLVGRIPAGTQFNTFDENSFDGNVGLCGFPLPKRCSEYTQKPELEAPKDQEEESGFTWKVVTLGYGCGTLVGLVMGYLMLLTRKVKWFNAIADATESLVLKKKKKKRSMFISGNVVR